MTMITNTERKTCHVDRFAEQAALQIRHEHWSMDQAVDVGRLLFNLKAEKTRRLVRKQIGIQERNREAADRVVALLNASKEEK